MRTNPRALVQRMADKGLLRVTPSPRDARCKLVALTAEGDVVSMTLSELKALISASSLQKTDLHSLCRSVFAIYK